MKSSLLWVHKTATSANFSHSGKTEETRIRRHVQQTRERDTDGAADIKQDVATSASQRHHRSRSGTAQSHKMALATSLRPNRTLGRMRGGRVALALHEQTPSPSPLARTLSSLSDLESSEREGLIFFELRTAHDWAGWADAPFWTVLALPLAHSSQAIARGALALAALHESHIALQDCRRRSLRRTSLVQVNKAVAALRGAKLSHFEAIISCLLLICYQNIQGYPRSFLMLKSGLRLLHDRHPFLSGEEEQLVSEHVDALFQRLSCRPCVMNDLHAAFMMSLRRRRTGMSPKVMPSNPALPTTFSSLAEARSCLERILNWGHDALAFDEESLNPSEGLLKKLHEMMTKWQVGLDAQSAWSMSDGTTASRSAGLLQAASIFGLVIIETAGICTEIAYDVHIPSFTKIIHLIEQALDLSMRQQKDISFGIDNGLVDILAFVGVKCRDPSLRRRALNLLLDSGRIEGDRVAHLPGQILHTLIESEERGLCVFEASDVPETHRRRLIRGHQIYSRGEVELYLAASPYDPSLGAAVEKCIVSLPGADKRDSARNGKRAELDENATPDAIFGPGFAEFLEDRAERRYYRMEVDRFFFPIPRC